MKIGKMEGTPEEIRGLIEDNGLKISDYLEKPEKPIAKIWLVIPSVLLVLSYAILVFAPSLPAEAKTFTFLFGCCSGLWLSACTHILYKNNWVAMAVLFVALLVMLVALGVMRPIDLASQAQKVVQDNLAHNE
jgi:hypothetical protein